MQRKNVISFLIVLLAVFSLIGCNSKKNTYSVKFNTNGGTSITTQSVKKNGNIVLPPDPIKENYLFVEWQINGQKYDFTNVIDKDVVLTAIWEEKKSVTYKVTFDYKSNQQNLERTVNKGSIVSQPSNPTKYGYIFKEWQINGQKYDFNKAIEANITLIAVWEEKTFAVIFDSKGGNSIANQNVKEGQVATKPTIPTRTGYKFVEWQLEEKTYDFNAKIENNITLVAKWVALQTYTVTFNLNGGTGNIANQKIYEGLKSNQPLTNPTKTNYVFKEWQLDGKKYDFSSIITRNITLIAIYEEDSYIKTMTCSYNTKSQNYSYKEEHKFVFEGNLLSYSDRTLFIDMPSDDFPDNQLTAADRQIQAVNLDALMNSYYIYNEVTIPGITLNDYSLNSDSVRTTGYVIIHINYQLAVDPYQYNGSQTVSGYLEEIRYHQNLNDVQTKRLQRYNEIKNEIISTSGISYLVNPNCTIKAGY